MDMEVIMTETGGVEGLLVKPQAAIQPARGELLIRNEAVGVNFIDIYFRQGFYPLPRLPAILGVEGAGVVHAVGEGVGSFVQGDRVALPERP